MTLNTPTGGEATPIVRSLLDAAGLTVSDEELDGFARMYPSMRVKADAMYQPELEPEAPALHFDPTVGVG